MQVVLMDSTFLFFKSGFVTDEEVERRESALRNLLNNDRQFRVKEDASVEVAQVILVEPKHSY